MLNREEAVENYELEATLVREAVESAMDRYDDLGPDRFKAEYPQFKDPKDFWVRPSRPRSHSRYPSKPIAAIAQGATTLNGGWSTRKSAAALLHNAGYIIVDSDDTPHSVPPEEHLITGAERIRACALTNYIAPARDRGDASVTIIAGKLHNEIGLSASWANVCQALGGSKFLAYASVPAPLQNGPQASTTTSFTYDLKQRTTPMTQPSPSATNLILYGPPGTGKTYETAAAAVRLCMGEEEAAPLLSGNRRDDLVKAYKMLARAGRIEFITFHQSYSYEDFVEGLRPTTDVETDDRADSEEGDGAATLSGGFELRSVDGIFKRICERALHDAGNDRQNSYLDRQRPIFKMALGRRGSEEDRIAEGLNKNLIHLGWGGNIDWSDERFESFEEIRREWREKKDPAASGTNANIAMIYSFRSALQVGDYVVLSDGRDSIRAIGKVTGEYYYDTAAPYHPHRRPVEWLWRSPQGADRDIFYKKNFRRQSVYQLRRDLIEWDALETIVLGETGLRQTSPARPYVLVIDEINRANISKVFGELITLLEPDKRIGEANEIMVRLPYSNDSFGVPANLHIVGTMNTTDRSIALLDTALRRRFDFRELMPRPSLLKIVDGIDLSALLATINDRIEYLFDREHQIGHAYFINCTSRRSIDEVMRRKVIPLLAEYFYEDWGKVAVVLGDGNETGGDREGKFLDCKRLVPPKGMGGDSDTSTRFRWTVRNHFNFSDFMQG